MLPGFGYRFLRQRRRHNNIFVGHGALLGGAGILKEMFRDSAIAQPEIRAFRHDAETKPDIAQQKTPGTNLRQARRKAGDAFAACRLSTPFAGQDQGHRTFA